MSKWKENRLWQKSLQKEHLMTCREGQVQDALTKVSTPETPMRLHSKLKKKNTIRTSISQTSNY